MGAGEGGGGGRGGGEEGRGGEGGGGGVGGEVEACLTCVLPGKAWVSGLSVFS